MPYPPDPDFRAAALELLATAWPKLPAAIRRAQAWGADWFEGSTPYTVLESGRPVAIVGVLDMPVVVDGRPEALAGVHGVCVHPEHRAKGHLRTAMTAALADIDARGRPAALWTDQPEIYGRFGFRPCPERVFAGPLPRPFEGGAVAPPVPLDDPSAVAALRDALTRRAPTSQRAGTREDGWHFLLDIAIAHRLQAHLRALPALDAYAVAEPIEGGVRIHDVVASRIPTLEDVVRALGFAARRVETTFSPDRLDAPWLAASAAPEGDIRMLRGLEMPPEASFSPLTRC